eukprot:CAMPEP_0202685480 /NCGR_PEP_ID=MMETSP1385-20130828/1257_1 /ASSEMBLY_ACC=CAM_ASM_000861 /TAXON_ID=933848 /ORGANISM="Elphidium margaritaceum" /LENGTH=187 /DNA_ID=CAMNT_0049339841 /DNA_START=983 /DNA_END=1546 /DNA_ORIENTATION=+
MTSIYGGYVWYQSEDNIRCIDSDKQFIQRLPLLIIDAKSKRKTNSVKHLCGKYETVFNGVFQSIEEIGQQMTQLVTNQDIETSKAAKLYKTVNELFSMHHALSCATGISNESVQDIKRICHSYGMDKGFKVSANKRHRWVVVSMLNKLSGKCYDQGFIADFQRGLMSKGYASYLIETGHGGMQCEFY